MTKFEDQLFTDLMAEYRPVLQRLERPAPPARRPVPRPVWVAASAAGVAGAVTAGVVGFGGTTPAYAVTRNADGTVTLAISSPAGVPGANAKLRVLGSHVVVVPARPGCPAITSLGRPASGQATRTAGSAALSKDGSITVDVRGIPAGDTAVVAATTLPGGGMTLAEQLVRGPAPACVSLPPRPGNGGSPGTPGHGTGGRVQPGTGKAGVSTARG
jgi:hypothetical protein